MNTIYTANIELVNVEMGCGRGVDPTFSAANHEEAAMSAQRAAMRLAEHAKDGFNRVGSIKLWAVLSQAMEADSGYLGNGVSQVWEWKSDNWQELPPPSVWQRAAAAMAESRFYMAVIKFERQEREPLSHEIHFTSADDVAAVNDARKWSANRQKAIPEWFGKVLSLEVSCLEPGVVDEDGVVPPHAGRTVHSEVAPAVNRSSPSA